jgi:tRNA nucleotidyltransferase (CCA-adding enzyme)
MDYIYELLTGDVTNNITSNLYSLLEIIPELKPCIGFDQKHPHHHLDVWEHTLLALSMSEEDLEVRLALLLHDIGKPYSYQDEEVRHFHGHPEVSAMMARKILNRLGLDQESINRICYLIRYHDTDIRELDNNELITKLYKVQTCDALAHHPNHLDKRKKYLEDIKVKMLKMNN